MGYAWRHELCYFLFSFQDQLKRFPSIVEETFISNSCTLATIQLEILIREWSGFDGLCDVFE